MQKQAAYDARRVGEIGSAADAERVSKIELARTNRVGIRVYRLKERSEAKLGQTQVLINADIAWLATKAKQKQTHREAI